jgi:hypothetical protein
MTVTDLVRKDADYPQENATAESYKASTEADWLLTWTPCEQSSVHPAGWAAMASCRRTDLSGHSSKAGEWISDRGSWPHKSVACDCSLEPIGLRVVAVAVAVAVACEVDMGWRQDLAAVAWRCSGFHRRTRARGAAECCNSVGIGRKYRRRWDRGERPQRHQFSASCCRCGRPDEASGRAWHRTAALLNTITLSACLPL